MRAMRETLGCTASWLARGTSNGSDGSCDPSSPWQKSRCIRPTLNPTDLRCSSVEYCRYSPSSRLVRRAQRRSRCDAGLSPRTARSGLPGLREGARHRTAFHVRSVIRRFLCVMLVAAFLATPVVRAQSPSPDAAGVPHPRELVGNQSTLTRGELPAAGLAGPTPPLPPAVVARDGGRARHRPRHQAD